MNGIGGKCTFITGIGENVKLFNVAEGVADMSLNGEMITAKSTVPTLP